MTGASAELVRFISEELDRPVGAGAARLAERVREIHGGAVKAILFYGSCLRRKDDFEGVLDLYVLVDRYRDAYRNPLLVILNTLLPPNVFYVETETGGRTVRAKYAVLSRRRLVRSTSRRAFESYFWARFAQPCALVYASEPAVRAEVAGALAEAVVALVRHGVPLAPERFRAAELWTATLRETYRSEVRAERGGAPADLYGAAPGRYDEVARLALPLLGYPVSAETVAGETGWAVRVPAWERRLAPWLWALRRVHGKVFFLLRLLRNGLIFEGGLDYLLWKIERHSGVKVDPSWRKRRFRLLAAGAEIWRLYRRGAFR
jgi:predicted nucleotidyltransferase